MTPLIAKVNELELLRGRVARLELDLAFDLGIVPGKPTATPNPVLPKRTGRKRRHSKVTPAIRAGVIQMTKDRATIEEIRAKFGLAQSTVSLIRRDAKKKPK